MERHLLTKNQLTDIIESIDSGMDVARIIDYIMFKYCDSELPASNPRRHIYDTVNRCMNDEKYRNEVREYIHYVY